MSNIHSFYIVYDGPALELSEMDVRQLAPALHAVGDLFDAANRVLYGKKFRAQVCVKGSFKTGCFGIDFTFAQTLADSFVGLFSNQYIDAALNVAELIGLVSIGNKKVRNSLISLLNKLKGRQIKRAVELDDGRVLIEVDDEHYEVEREIIGLLRDLEVRKALDAVITEPLKVEGISSFGSGRDKEHVFLIKKEEAHYYAAPPVADELLSETTYDTIVKVVNVAFQEDNLWRISEGSEVFFAKIEDMTFLTDVQNNERVFAKDDLFKVRLRKRQILGEKGKVKIEATIEQVLEHRSAARQIALPFEKIDKS